jgi:hypothetical protein
MNNEQNGLMENSVGKIKLISSQRLTGEVQYPK